jgi:uncharacterized membrane protein
MDTNTRTLAKTVTYRLTTFVLTFVITFLLTGQQQMSAGLAVMSLTLGALTFIIHERLWTRVKWGNLGGFDQKIRSAVKTITYRLWSLFAVFVIGLLIGLKSSDALLLTVALNIMYLTTHYVNERLWNRVKWGKIY